MIISAECCEAVGFLPPALGKSLLIHQVLESCSVAFSAVQGGEKGTAFSKMHAEVAAKVKKSCKGQ